MKFVDDDDDDDRHWAQGADNDDDGNDDDPVTFAPYELTMYRYTEEQKEFLSSCRRFELSRVLSSYQYYYYYRSSH